jgi:tRNA pseudouridine32 synthase / 23S rRNA pseudouridine746 synthase
MGLYVKSQSMSRTLPHPVTDPCAWVEPTDESPVVGMVDIAADRASLVVVAVDECLVVVDKPANLPSVPGRAAGLDDCAWSRVRLQHADALVVHRLDMATSGLLLFARGAQAQRHLSRAFEDRAVDKRYLADVHGRVDADEGTIDVPLAADWPNRPRQRVDHSGGRAALTRYRVIERRDAGSAKAVTRLELQPVTGRSHQLRVHLAWMGHPIVGDSLYAAAPSASTPTLPSPQALRGQHLEPSLPRLRLHAHRLELPHPAQGRRVRFEAALPSWVGAGRPPPPWH